MNATEINLILRLLDLALVYGVPTIRRSIENTEKDVLTEEDIDNLKINEEFEDY